MSEIVTYQCDRCNKAIDYNMPVSSLRLQRLNSKQGLEIIDLCEECQKSLEMWLESGEDSELNDYARGYIDCVNDVSIRNLKMLQSMISKLNDELLSEDDKIKAIINIVENYVEINKFLEGDDCD